ncbi:MAG: molybdenum cofactor biosynthesis protein MoaE [Candidatus Dormibacteraeota bacterium]|uniref:Molybdenum cofactor biosynthesis protein MoaE n=1 Tax=Candidatus Dormiibacter inghamiae TaxID=3127013 RepID=A0A934K6D5_9BACT|nr:molybdenum cofactor biosynthesis protein MoaE [Candidatus Dormibacteraeota bacterium]MBJ7606244.1 molybdenum cofactor biosynthesis protein MoaE [Candidatus Dormibacteraeota bacterium]
MITVRLFARLREQAGVASEQLPGGGNIGDLYQALRQRHPALEADQNLIRPARNQNYAAWEDEVADGDEIAFIPPVSGGMGTAALIELTAEVLDARRLEAAVAHPGAGAICTFTGIVRDSARGKSVTHLEYEAYAGMAEVKMTELADEIGRRWPAARVAMAHRIGKLDIGEASVVVTVACPHRGEAIAACHWGIDRLKESVPVWKKEFASSGAVWIEGPAARP